MSEEDDEECSDIPEYEERSHDKSLNLSSFKIMDSRPN